MKVKYMKEYENYMKNTWTWKILKLKISENIYKVTGM